MRHRLLARVPAAVLVLVIGGGGALTGCSDDSETPDGGDGSAAADVTPDAEPSDGATDPASDPNSPFVVAASAVATRSRDQVVQLHAMGVGTTGTGDLPQDQIPQLAGAITTELTAQIEAATVLEPPKKSPAAELVAALDTYRALSRALSKWTPNQPLPDSWFDRLQKTDDDWKSSLGALSELSGDDLLADLPPLLMPEST